MITVANFMDPGVDLIIDSAKADSELVMMHKRKEPKSRLTYNYHKPKFTIKHELGWTNLEVYYSQQLDKNVKGKPKRIGRGYGIYLSNSTQKRRYQNKKDPECVFRLSGKISKDAAKRINTSQARLSKFLGDFMQVLTAVRTIKNTQNRGTYHYALTTGDTMMANMFLYICTVNGVTPKLWFLTSAQGTAKVIGLNNIIQKPNRQNAGRAGSQITGVASERPNSKPVNNKNTATSRNGTTSSGNKNGNKNGNNGVAGKMIMKSQGQNQNKRTPTPSVLEGSGNSNNTTTSRKNGTRAPAGAIGRLGGTPIQVVNENKGVKRKTPNKPNNILAAALANQGLKRNRPNTKNGPPNAQSGVGSRNSIAGNKKNNLNNVSQPIAKKARINERNNQRGVKRVRNNNVSQSTAKRVNTNRNKLLRNLKKKNLRNFVVNGLMKSYDNKTKTANQIIREANNFGKTFAAGRTAQRMGTLRKRP